MATDFHDGLFGRHRLQMQTKTSKDVEKRSNNKELDFLPDGSHFSPHRTADNRIFDYVSENDEDHINACFEASVRNYRIYRHHYLPVITKKIGMAGQERNVLPPLSRLCVGKIER